MPASRFATPASAWPARSIRNWLTVWRSTSRTRERSRWSMRIWGPNSIRDSVSRSDLCGPVYHRCSPFPPYAVFCEPFVHRQAGGQRPRCRSHPGLEIRREGSDQPASRYVQRVGYRRPEGFLDRQIQLCGKGAVRFCRGDEFRGELPDDPSCRYADSPLRRGVLLPLGRLVLRGRVSA